MANKFEEETSGQLRYRSRPFSIILFAAGTAALIGGLVLYSISSTSSSSSGSSHVDQDDSLPDIVTVDQDDSWSTYYTLKRVNYNALSYFEGTRDSLAKYTFLEAYQAVVEPYAEMEMHLYDDSYLASDRVFEFEVCKTSDSSDCVSGELSSAYSTSVQFSGCNPFDTFTITVEEKVMSTGQSVGSATSTAVCLYVRRELRTLTDEDRETFLDTQYTLSAVSQEEGEAKYGENYWSQDEFVLMHFYNAGNRSHDRIHSGNGFYPQHLKLQNMVELSMQSVNPAVALPYWDFTIEEANDEGPYDSEILQSMYGAFSRPKEPMYGFTYEHDRVEDGRIKTGRWTNNSMLQNPFEDFKYGYGYLRSGWSMNPSPYVSRYTTDYADTITLPTCTSHYNALTKTYANRMMKYLEMAAPHVATHEMWGGMYGCDVLYEAYEMGYITDEAYIAVVCSELAMNTFPGLWRSGYINVKDDCTLDTSDYKQSSCGYTCPTQYYNSIKNSITGHISSYLSSTSETVKKYFTEFLCDSTQENHAGRIFHGDHMELSSPIDVSFWVFHPTLERLLQARLMVNPFQDMTWASDPVNDDVCDHPSCYDEISDTTDYFDYCCDGHFESSQLKYIDDNGDEYYLGLTNGEQINLANPTSPDYGMPYIYDNFEWSHCDEDFSSLFVAKTPVDTSVDNPARR